MVDAAGRVVCAAQSAGRDEYGEDWQQGGDVREEQNVFGTTGLRRRSI